VLHVAGTPLHETDLWAVEPAPAPARVAESLHPLPTVSVPHATVRRGVGAVTAALVDAVASGLVPVCDAVTDADLDVVHAAALAASEAHPAGALLVGSGALADAAVRALPPQPRPGARPADTAYATSTQPRLSAAAAASVLFVLGTRAPGVAAQLRQLSAAHSTHTLLLAPERLLDDPDSVSAELAGRPTPEIVVVALDPAAPTDPTRSRALSQALARAVAPLLDDVDAAFLSGGETARAVLDRLDVHALEVVAELETGTVASRRPGGRIVVTRPGSFGDPASLVRVADHLLGHPSASRTASTHTATSAVSGATTEENS
jgi:4-hydroxythreonine-4-phosphate dehydrogenase